MMSATMVGLNANYRESPLFLLTDPYKEPRGTFSIMYFFMKQTIVKHLYF